MNLRTWSAGSCCGCSFFRLGGALRSCLSGLVDGAVVEIAAIASLLTFPTDPF
jgi:hypothetical protein